MERYEHFNQAIHKDDDCDLKAIHASLKSTDRINFCDINHAPNKGSHFISIYSLCVKFTGCSSAERAKMRSESLPKVLEGLATPLSNLAISSHQNLTRVVENKEREHSGGTCFPPNMMSVVRLRLSMMDSRHE